MSAFTWREIGSRASREWLLRALPEEIANLQAFAYMTKSYPGVQHDRQDNP